MLLNHVGNRGISQAPQQVGSGAGMIFTGRKAAGFCDVVQQGASLDSGEMEIAAAIVYSLRYGKGKAAYRDAVGPYIVKHAVGFHEPQAFLTVRDDSTGGCHKHFY
jgi:hypothetical protein